ncbi:hypothetical protein [Mammaliicoccus sciuri]|uniref:hypothetical protein n=1 Tax=Mammaliicoccus sciuri TaxID=1296 RepID=UPI002DB55A48|nr:hypothetical protein [Mammaliicoccus sciuri]MEB6232589.1 hypothetical protein [Mammaliicoccus sciuri]
MKLVIKENEQREIALLNITHYNDFKEYQKYNNLDQEEFIRMLKVGHIQDITLGTYNGSTNTFKRDIITSDHIINAINTEIKESDFYNYFENEFIEKNNLKTSNDWIRLYAEFYQVYTLNGSIFVEME